MKRRPGSNRRGIRLPSEVVSSGGSPPAWVPTDVAGLSLWIDPSDATTVTMGASGVMQVASKDAAQGRVAGDQFFYAQSASYEPALQTLNGLDAIRFTGWTGGDFMRLYENSTSGYQTFHTNGTQNGVVGTSESYTMLVVFQTLANGAAGGQPWQITGLIQMAQGYGPSIMYKGGSPQYTQMYSYCGWPSPYAYFPFDPAHNQGIEITQGTTYCGIVSKTDSGVSPNTSPIYGTVSGTGLGSVFASGQAGRLYRPAQYYINLGVNGYSFAIDSYADALVGEILLYDTSISMADMTSAYNYLKAKWGTV